jgi:hypothetical protein
MLPNVTVLPVWFVSVMVKAADVVPTNWSGNMSRGGLIAKVGGLVGFILATKPSICPSRFGWIAFTVGKSEVNAKPVR